MAARKQYHVSYITQSTNWVVTHQGQTLSRHVLKDDAVTAGTKVAKANIPSQLIVHRMDGTIEYEYTYGDDPFPPKG